MRQRAVNRARSAASLRRCRLAGAVGLWLAWALGASVAFAAGKGDATTGGDRRQPGAQVLPGDAQPRILALLGAVGFERRDAASGAVIDQAQIERDRVRFVVHGSGPGAGGEVARRLATIELLPRGEARTDEPTSASFAIRVAVEPGADAGARDFVARTIAEIVAHDHGDLYRAAVVQREEQGRWLAPDDQAQLRAALLAAWLALLLTFAMMAHARLLRRPAWTGRIVVSHLLPATLQVVIFGYWSLYDRGIDDALALTLVQQVLYAVALDLWFGLIATRRLEFGVGALPITLSTNLFVIFPPGWMWVTLGALLLAIFGKRFIRLRHGHLFNPSAFGLTVVGFIMLTVHGASIGDTAAQFSLSPNATIVILLLGTIVQWRLGVAIISIGAVLGIWLTTLLQGAQIYEPSWAPVTLVLVLLVTDPATSPKRPVDRFLYGVLAGVGMRTAGQISLELFQNDFYGKVAGVVLANLSVPFVSGWVDRLADATPRWRRLLAALQAALAPRWRALHIVTLWLMILGSSAAKHERANRFMVYQGLWQQHLRNETPLLDPGPERRPDCSRNPLFCDEFSVGLELQCWLGDRDDPACPRPRRPAERTP